MSKCHLPPLGWWCSREAPHAGPCAARRSQRWAADAELAHIKPLNRMYGRNDEGYWFVDETQSACFGPYDTLDEAVRASERYFDWLDRPDECEHMLGASEGYCNRCAGT